MQWAKEGEAATNVNPDISKLRIKIGDRVRDMRGEEGTVVWIEGDNDGLLWWVSADMDEGGTVTKTMGEFEKIHRVKLGAT